MLRELGQDSLDNTRNRPSGRLAPRKLDEPLHFDDVVRRDGGRTVTKVFVSSVFTDLEDERWRLIQTLQRGAYDVKAMEHWGARPDVPLDACLSEVRRSDAVVLIIGPRYGSELPEGISYTHAEFREAKRLGIPVLAFIVPRDPLLPPEQASKIDNFIAEVGSATVYTRLDPPTGLEQLPALVLAALTRAAAAGQLGGRFRLFQPFELYYQPLLRPDGGVLSHLGEFKGRAAELAQLTAFIEGSAPLFILRAPGGTGKSRLLLEAARLTDRRREERRVLFVDSGASWSADDINTLPALPTVLIFDDAHRRQDLDRLIVACRHNNDHVRCIAACRPSAGAAVEAMLSQASGGVDAVTLDLAPLSSVDATAMAIGLLGTDYERWARRLVERADRNALVIAVGAKCIATKSVTPDTLDRTPAQFRATVLDRLLDDPGLTLENAAVRRRTLEVLSAIGPALSEGDELLKPLSAMLSQEEHETRRLLASLERQGFLLRRGRLIRVTPDVLADHLLYRASVDGNGRATGFVERALAVFGPAYFENLLSNAAELDWRTAEGSAHDKVLTTIWRDLMQAVPGISNPNRTKLLEQLRRPALFAPGEVLKIVEWIMEHPDAPADPHYVKWGLDDVPDHVFDQVVDLLTLIASHPDFTDQCLRRLWELAARADGSDRFATSRARHSFESLLKYAWRPDLFVVTGLHARTVQFVVGVLQDPTRAIDATWAVTTLGVALHRIGEANRVDREAFHFRPFALSEYYTQLSDRRTCILDCLRELALGQRSREAVSTLAPLGALLEAPEGPLGQPGDPAQLAVWLPEARSALRILREVAQSASSEVLRYLARRALREVSAEKWPAISEALAEALHATPAQPTEGVFDLLFGLPWADQEDDRHDEEREVQQRCDAAAASLWASHQTPSSVVVALIDAIRTLEEVSAVGHPHTGRLGQSILNARPQFAAELLNGFVDAGRDGWGMLRPLLSTFHERDKQAAESYAISLLASPHDSLRAFALDALQFLVPRSEAPMAILIGTRHLATDPSDNVRGALAQVVRRFGKIDPEAALDVLTTIEWRDNPVTAASVLDVLDARYGIDPTRLSEAQIGDFLGRVRRLPSLDGRNYDILQFIAYASTRSPRPVVQMLLDRVADAEERERSRRDESHRPLPYGGRGLSLPGLSSSPECEACLRMIRDPMLRAKGASVHWLPELFAVVAKDLDAALRVLREWTMSGDRLRLERAVMLLRGMEHAVVYGAHSFVADTLDAAAAFGEEVIKSVSSSFFVVAASGSYSGRPGHPAPRHVADKADAAALAEQYKARPVVRDFFKSLVEHAEWNMKRHQQEWEELGDDE